MSAHALTLTATEERIAQRIDPEATGRVAVSDAAGGVAFASVGQVMEFGKLMAVAGVAVPKHLRGNVGACMAVCIQAIEWRLSPFAVANKSYSVNDRLAYESQLIQAVILQRAPIKGRLKVEYTGEGAERVCRVWARLKDEEEIVEYTSPPFGSIKTKNSPLWVADPDQQFFYYSARALCRRHFPDVLLGVYAKEEVEESPSDPARATDITPRTLEGKLDALATRPARAETVTAANDALITDLDEAGDEEARGTAGEDPDETDDTPRGKLIEKLRAKAMKSPKTLKLGLGALTAEEQALLTDEDRASLERAAAAMQPEPAEA